MTPQPDDRQHLLLRVCQLHYEQQLTQQEVGDRLHLTRWQVGRMLKEAHAKGIVRIEIIHPAARDHGLEQQLVQASRLTEAVVVPAAADAAQTLRLVARAAGDFLADLSPSPRTVAVSWGWTMSELARAIPPDWAPGPVVVQANGGLSRPGPGDPASIISSLARQGRGSSVFLPAPAIVDSPRLAEALRREPSIAEVMTLARSADVLVYSLGHVHHGSVLVRSGCLREQDEAMLTRRGAVGDVVGRFINRDGQPVSEELQARSIGLDLADVAGAEMSIAVAAGEEKHAVAEACVRHGLCRVLVCDSTMAVHLIQQLTNPMMTP